MPLVRVAAFFVAYLLIFIIQKPLFMALHHSVMGAEGIGDWLDVIWHGLPMDCSMAAYLTMPPILFTIGQLWSSAKVWNIAMKLYVALTSGIIAIVAVSDAVLYGYWNFRLDTTPFFYFFTSPKAAMASAGFWDILLGVAITLALSVLFYIFIVKFTGMVSVKREHKAGYTIGLLVTAGLLIIPMRGGLTVSTMNLSRSYFSHNQRLNHAAINPMFSFMYSASHQNKFDKEFHYYDNDKCAELFAEANGERAEHAMHDTICTVEKPDIYIIILESFSNHLLPSLEGEAIATGLDSIAQRGLLFTNFYASGARTDRAIPAILGAFPAQPTTSLMKYAKKIENAESLPKVLRDSADYEMSYYYGGDANFTNMLAYLVNAGFDKVISDKDFKASELKSKWGAHDHVVFGRVLNDIKADNGAKRPKLRVIQTSSSHEPFEVPYLDERFKDSDRKNAFAYADRAVSDFVKELEKRPEWKRTLVFITADHYGVYPQNIENALDRHRIPLIITGGALASEASEVDTLGGQTDIAATILAILGIDFRGFRYSHDLFDQKAKRTMFFSEPGIACLINDSDTVVFGLDNNAVIHHQGANAQRAEERCKAYLQTIYNDISNL